ANTGRAFAAADDATGIVGSRWFPDVAFAVRGAAARRLTTPGPAIPGRAFAGAEKCHRHFSRLRRLTPRNHRA
ncbi:MAG: hypothetical protein AB1651_17555, partial [Pseudomonadota bacterium]